ncbi:hypothetical protein ACFSFW_12090 [Fredinandcohnia salidurans]|uniref:DUF4901 domain-containing protein n=1 Tax=Fredinandcohnia salidurans TaxID=2595041 RepID=A0ABW4MMY7_9BACI
MDERTQELVDFTREKFGLSDYYLETYSFNRSVSIFNETIYTLSMEWFPNHCVGQEYEDENPDGTAVITIDVKSRNFESVIFVMGQTFATNGVTFTDKNDIIKWIEQETGLAFEQQFQLHKEEEGELHFKECIDGIAVSPSGMIQVNFDQDGRLTLFSAHGHFPAKEMVKIEPFTLAFEKIEDIAKEQVKLIESPLMEQQRLISAYAVEEIYVRNDQKDTIPFEVIVDVRGYMKIEKTLDWDEPIEDSSFERKEITWHEEVTAEQAFLGEPSPDSLPITEAEQKKCMTEVRDFLRRVYPSDSGVWMLKSLHRDSGYIHAIVRANKQDQRVFQRKINVMIESENIEAVNYKDNQMMLEMFDEFEEPEKVVISKNEAYEKIKEKFELEPYYVYDFDHNQYVLCGKIDCQFAVHASTGKVLPLDEL